MAKRIKRAPKRIHFIHYEGVELDMEEPFLNKKEAAREAREWDKICPERGPHRVVTYVREDPQ